MLDQEPVAWAVMLSPAIPRHIGITTVDLQTRCLVQGSKSMPCESHPPLTDQQIDAIETRVNKLGPSPDRWKVRSKTYSGIANAIASQWGIDRECVPK